MPIRILIADDHGVLRAGLRALLSAEEGIAVLGEAGDGPEALRLATLLEPDMVLLDLSMPGLSGIEVTRQLKQVRPRVNTLILTVHEDQTLLEEALHAGASGYILKKAVESELIDAIRAVSRGEMYVHPAMTRALLGKLAPESTPPKQEHEFLTPRETEVLQLIAQGHTNRQIAALLNISIRTVESHRANLMGKLGLQSRVELVRYARDKDLLDK
jgi:two-component system response regulator NreC